MRLGGRTSSFDRTSFSIKMKLVYIPRFLLCCSGVPTPPSRVRVWQTKDNTDFLNCNGNRFKLLLPAKWNPSKKREFTGQPFGYEDNWQTKDNTDFLNYNGNRFKLLLPAKWNPSKKREFTGQLFGYEDNIGTISNVSVMVTPSDNKIVIDYGSHE